MKPVRGDEEFASSPRCFGLSAWDGPGAWVR